MNSCGFSCPGIIERCDMGILQHHFNSLHLFCRLRAIGVSKKAAMRFARAWERLIHPYLYRREMRKKTA